MQKAMNYKSPLARPHLLPFEIILHEIKFQVLQFLHSNCIKFKAN